MNIRQAMRGESSLIADVILMALGDEIVDGFAGEQFSRDDVHRLFAGLAEMDNSQYSYRNTLAAVDDDGRVMGMLVCYDGALLHAARERFFEAVEAAFGRNMRGMPDETVPDEYYLDSIGVFEAFRGRGVASALLRAGVEKARGCGKPAGLLVERDNERAYRLYRSLGFKKVGETPFADTLMDHLQM